MSLYSEWFFSIIFWMVFSHYFQNGFFPLFSEWFFPLLSEWFFSIILRMVFLKNIFLWKIIKQNNKENLKKKIFHPFQNGKYPYFPEWIFSIFSRMGINHSCIWMEYFHPLAGWHINLGELTWIPLGANFQVIYIFGICC